MLEYCVTFFYEFWFIFSMAITRGSGSGANVSERLGLTGDEIHEMITTQVTMSVREAIPEIFGYVKTTVIELFDELYAFVSELVVVTATVAVVVVGFRGRRMLQYHDFGNTKPLEFDEVRDLITAMRWI